MSQDSAQLLQPGTQFGAYRIARLLGEGAFGAVYESYRTPLNKRVALKVLKREMTTNPGVIQRFLREAELVAQIEHPHIVDVLDVGVHEGVPFLAMEFLEGMDLSARLREGALDVPTALELLLPIFSAAQTVHAHGIVHRDLKPENIFLSRTVVGGVQPKLLDFGIAKVQQAEHSLTRTNSLMGTPFYMSPEQVRESKNIDARSDQWALAIIVYECVTARRVFEGGSLLEILSAIAAGPITPPRSIVATIPSGFDAALLRALERDPNDRYPSVRELAQALLPFAAPAVRDRWAPLFSDEHTVPTSPLQLSASGLPNAPRSVGPVSAFGTGPQSTRPTPPPDTLDRAGSLDARESPVSLHTLEPTAHPLVARPAPAAKAPSRAAAVSGGVALLLALGLGGLYQLRHSSAATAAPPPPRVSLPIAIAVHTVPPTAALALDGAPAGIGALARQLPRDGQTHTLRVSADGYETVTVTFRDEAPAEQITLRPIAPAAPIEAAPTTPPAASAPVASAPAASAPAQHPTRHGHAPSHGRQPAADTTNGRIRAE